VKKIILAFATVAIIGFGGNAQVSAHNAPQAVDCVDQPSSDPSDPCFNPVLYPPTTPASSVLPPTVPTTTLAPLTPILPRTGSSGMSPILGMGALLVLGGGLIVVAARRRSTTSGTTA
jgi:LPXTG-motif cell wall-anchored protein